MATSRGLRTPEAARNAAKLHLAVSTQASRMDVKRVAGLETIRKTTRESLQTWARGDATEQEQIDFWLAFAT
ncbi:hypothetical protein HDV57DRAFT_261922 [Trichoderma longibrachiatum]